MSQYDPSRLEPAILSLWANSSTTPKPFNPNAPSFSLPLPPPNVTGVLHMGHAFQQTLMDILARYYRMKGYNVHWQGGVDHAGIATYMIVCRQLKARGQEPSHLSPEAFLAATRDWAEQSRTRIFAQMKRLGLSLEADQARFTLDPLYERSVRDAFCTLYQENLIYRGLRLVNWDPTLQTAISDLEVATQDRPGQMHHLFYASTEGDGSGIWVGTTRPETLFGDVALVVNPEDTRYHQWIGKSVLVPLIKRPIPVLTHAHASPELGTGAVKITPAHDFNDAKVARDLELPFVNILDARARLLPKAEVAISGHVSIADVHLQIPLSYVGLAGEEARARVLADLKKQGGLGRSEPTQIPMPICERSGACIEPWLTPQWFLKLDGLARSALDSARSGALSFLPNTYLRLFESWLSEPEDWCLSRQLPWGHPIPAWWNATKTQHYVGTSEAEIRQRYGLDQDEMLTPDPDVLDTWFSSALWSFAALERESGDELLRHYHPQSLLVTGFDIIFFWVARMVMLTLKLRGELPFRRVYITGLVRDAQGRKMSKSRGNVIDPMQLIEGQLTGPSSELRSSPPKTDSGSPERSQGFGADALRITLASLANQGRDILWCQKRLEGYRNFCNKLWNAQRLLEQLLASSRIQAPTPPRAEFSSKRYPLRLWFQDLFAQAVKKYERAMETCRFDLAAHTVYEFVWHQFCDWYLELAKPFARPESVWNQQACQDLVYQMRRVLKLCHPILPFLTEALWQRLELLDPTPGEDNSQLIFQSFPEASEDPGRQCHSDARCIQWFQSLLGRIRELKAAQVLGSAGGFSIRAQRISAFAPDQESWLELLVRSIIRPTRFEFCSEGPGAPEPGQSWTQWVVGPSSVWINVDEARVAQLIQKQLVKAERLEKELAGLQTLLADPKFRQKAPDSALTSQQTRLKEKMEQQRDLHQEIMELKTVLNKG